MDEDLFGFLSSTNLLPLLLLPPKDACKNLAFHFPKHWQQDKHAGNASEGSALIGLEGGSDLYE